jgi:hypothetical protein
MPGPVRILQNLGYVERMRLEGLQTHCRRHSPIRQPRSDPEPSAHLSEMVV